MWRSTPRRDAIQSAVQSFLQTLASLHKQILHLDDLQAFLAIQPAQPLATAPLPLTSSGNSAVGNGRVGNGKVGRRGQGTIEFVNVAFTYPDSDEPALANLSFCLAHGKTVAVVGENGAGKSTLALLLAGEFVCTDQRLIRVDGVDLPDD